MIVAIYLRNHCRGAEGNVSLGRTRPQAAGQDPL